MLDIRVTTGDGREYGRMSAGRLGELVASVGIGAYQFVAVRRIPDLPDVFVQVARDAAGSWLLEHRDGRPGVLFGTRLPGAEPVARIMVAWARREDGWDAAAGWERVELGPVEPVPELDTGTRREVEEYVRGLIRRGYDGRKQLAEDAEEWLVDGGERPVSAAQARRIVDRLWLERVEEQAGWEGVTDPERITAVFAGLEARGVVARENFTCCRSCGLAEIGAEREDGDEGAVRGFVFFHAQCVEAVAAGGTLSLCYGGFDGSEKTTAAVGGEIAAALREAGLSVRWDGSPGSAIAVTGLDWRRRLG
ncbi:hypothetical protein OG875_23220 [Streptomyces sp. NBC_01498]|uniref:DUF6891 domain-containing protein n=1 Tax=Streptomyces sp. NBC_01498 TaxID=2975870 RepID=UPI002E7ADE11|nr:hypothetical protein [Streptomyces sp. NBC_01498]WTL27218.1 hypothetical protein OG875_23220 [Streptomyces sp. NBC_01498]